MQRRHIDVTATTPAHPEAVYGLLVDGSSWPRWSPIESFERTTGRDQPLEPVPDRRIKYASLSGLPVRDYRGERPRLGLNPPINGGPC